MEFLFNKAKGEVEHFEIPSNAWKLQCLVPIPVQAPEAAGEQLHLLVTFSTISNRTPERRLAYATGSFWDALLEGMVLATIALL